MTRRPNPPSPHAVETIARGVALDVAALGEGPFTTALQTRFQATTSACN